MSQFSSNPVSCFYVRDFVTLNSTVRKRKFAINVGRKIIPTPRNARVKINVLTGNKPGIK